MMSNLIFKDRVRKHEFAKKYHRQSQILKMQRLMGVIIKMMEPLCAGLAGTWVINSSNDVAVNLMSDKTFQSLSRSNIFNNAMRSLMFNIVQLFRVFLDGSNAVLDNVYKMFSFYDSTNVNGYINNLLGFLWIPCLISLLTLGFTLIFNNQNRPDGNKILQNGLIITILVTGLPALLSTTVSMTQTFVNADFNNRGQNQSAQIIASCLTDYEYLYDWENQKFVMADETVRNTYTASGDYRRVNYIDINETMRYDNAGNPDRPNCSKWDDKNKVCALCTIVTMKNDGTYQCEHIDEPKWWEFFSDSYYYRYDMDYVTCLITLGAMSVAIIFSAIKIARILWELAIYRVLAMFFSLSDLQNGEKIKEILKAFAGAFVVIIVNTVLLKFFTIFSGWLSNQSMDGFSKSVMLVSVAIAVIDGPNLCQKLIGVDAGIRSAATTIGAMYMVGKGAVGAGKMGIKGGKHLAEFGKDTAMKSAMIGGFAVGTGAKAVDSLKSARSEHNKPKDQKTTEKIQQKSDKKQEKSNEISETRKQNMNDSIGRQVAKDAPRNMKSDPNYKSDSISAYKNAAAKLSENKRVDDRTLTDIAEDAYLHTHSEQLVNDAANIQDEAFANGKDMTEKDALTSAFADKHDDQKTVTPDGTYQNAVQSSKNKIDSLKQSQEQQGNTVESVRLANYAKISKNTRSQKNSGKYQDMSEVQAHTAEAAKTHGRTYDPAVPSSIEKIDLYQGNMSAALEHKKEIISHAQEYIKEQKQAGKDNISEEQAVAHVIANEDDYDMSYGFDSRYAVDIAEMIAASNKHEKSKNGSEQREERSRNINGNSSLNQNLGDEKQSHNKPRQSMIGAAKQGYEFGRRKKK